MRTGLMPVTYVLIAISVGLFVVSVSQNVQAFARSVFTPLHLRLDLYVPALEAGEFWRLVTSGFMHFGIFHIGFNMYILYRLGQMLEPAIGSIRFGLLYFASLLTGSLGVILTTNDQTFSAGASGAVFGLMGAAAVGLWLRGQNPFSSSLGQLILLNIVITFLVPNIAIGAHLGGLAGGALVGMVLLSPDRSKYPKAVQFGAPILLMIVSVGLSVFLTSPGA